MSVFFFSYWDVVSPQIIKLMIKIFPLAKSYQLLSLKKDQLKSALAQQRDLYSDKYSNKQTEC